MEQEQISNARHKVLEALAKYRYMTTEQFVFAGVSESKDSVMRRILPPLFRRERGKLIDFVNLGFIPGKGCRPRVYFLTKHGAQILADFERCDISEIQFAEGGMQYARDFDHRKAYIDYVISFHRWIDSVGGDILDECHYFDATGSNRKGTKSHAKTRLEMPDGFIIPDGLAHFDAVGKVRAVAVEVHRHTDPRRCAEQLGKHMDAIRERRVMNRFGIEHASLVFSVATDQGLCERIRTRMRDTPEWGLFAPLFRFADMDAIREDFGRAWVYADGSPAPLGGANATRHIDTVP